MQRQRLHGPGRDEHSRSGTGSAWERAVGTHRRHNQLNALAASRRRRCGRARSGRAALRSSRRQRRRKRRVVDAITGTTISHHPARSADIDGLRRKVGASALAYRATQQHDEARNKKSQMPWSLSRPPVVCHSGGLGWDPREPLARWALAPASRVIDYCCSRCWGLAAGAMCRRATGLRRITRQTKAALKAAGEPMPAVQGRRHRDGGTV